MAASYFLDTFAMVEYLGGNPRYSRYVDEGRWSTSLLNLAELYFVSLRDHTQDYADKVFLAFHRNLAEVSDEDVKEGMKTRLRLKARRIDLSYADAIGYSIALRMGSEFLTGDTAFKGMNGVEFVT